MKGVYSYDQILDQENSIIDPRNFCYFDRFVQFNKNYAREILSPMMLPTSAKPEQIPQLREEITKQLGLDKSLPEQYVAWIGNVAQGELGFSSWKNDRCEKCHCQSAEKHGYFEFLCVNFLTDDFHYGRYPLSGQEKFLCRSVLAGLFFDLYERTDVLLRFVFGVCIRSRLGWLPSNGMPVDGSGLGEWVRFLVLPVITLTITSLASTVRYVRNAMLDALSQDYIRTARSKGLSEKVVVYSHAFRNALIPIVTVVIAQIGTLFGGSMITESVFVWDGMGSTLLTALNRQRLLSG